jgi:hypothetical protein
MSDEYYAQQKMPHAMPATQPPPWETAHRPSPCAQQPTPASPVEQALLALAQTVGTHASHVHQLASRLTSVLRDAPVSQPSETRRPHGDCQLTDVLAQQSGELEALDALVQVLLERLAL